MAWKRSSVRARSGPLHHPTVSAIAGTVVLLDPGRAHAGSTPKSSNQGAMSALTTHKPRLADFPAFTDGSSGIA